MYISRGERVPAMYKKLYFELCNLCVLGTKTLAWPKVTVPHNFYDGMIGLKKPV